MSPEFLDQPLGIEVFPPAGSALPREIAIESNERVHEMTVDGRVAQDLGKFRQLEKPVASSMATTRTGRVGMSLRVKLASVDRAGIPTYELSVNGRLQVMSPLWLSRGFGLPNRGVSSDPGASVPVGLDPAREPPNLEVEFV